MARILRYVADKPKDMTPHRDGSLPFGAFVLSGRIQSPCVTAAWDVLAIAKSSAPVGPADDGEHYANAFGVNKLASVPVKTKYGIVPRSGAEVINTDEKAPAIEFGSGKKSVGDSKGKPRPQGGYNKPRRVLGRAGSKIGDLHE